jgi:hypothetical protein
MNPTQYRRCPGIAMLGSLVLFLAVNAPARAQESWDAIYQGDLKIGHVHTFIEHVTNKGQKLLRVRVDMEMKQRRAKDVVTIKQRYGSIETPEGIMLKIDHRSLVGEDEIRTFGDVNTRAGQMNLTFETWGNGRKNSQHKTIPWEVDVRGPYAVEQSLARSPMKAGESRTLKMYMPDVNRVCEVTIAAKGTETITLGDRKGHPLLRVEQTTTIDGQPRSEFDVTHWVDEHGQVLKSFQDLMGGLYLYRTTKEGATAPDTTVSVDSIVNSVIKVPQKISDSANRHHVRYRVTHKTEDPAKLLPTDRRQTIETAGSTAVAVRSPNDGKRAGEAGADKNAVILDVRTMGPEDGERGPAEVDEQFRRSNPMIASDDSLVQALARKAVGNATDPWEKAERIKRWVAKNLTDKNFSTTFAPASEVARNLQGDCTEHSVLAAAMYRAEGIPSRVAVGLMYVDHLGGFGYHMWNEVYVNGRWVALDSSFDQSAVDATHIKLSDSSLDGVAPFESFLPVVRVMGKMNIEPIEIR